LLHNYFFTLPEDRVSMKVIFYFDEIEMPRKFYPYFVEISIFRFPKFRFQNRNFDFDLLLSIKSKIQAKFHPKFVEISTFRNSGIPLFSLKEYNLNQRPTAHKCIPMSHWQYVVA
jgi:hypothetical protein